MKTAISLPDEVFAEAERLAGRLDVSRSELYRRALREYLDRHDPDRVTATLDRVLEDLAPEFDPFVAAAATRVLERADW